jgi:hypothetical protein
MASDERPEQENAVSNLPDENIEGRSVFSVETTPAGVVVSTVFLAQDGRIIKLPAVFPNLDYALDQINELAKLVKEHFEKGAEELNRSSAPAASAEGAQTPSMDIKVEKKLH